jgi:hypothetical protein
LGPRKADWGPWGLSALPHAKRGTRLARRRCPNQKIERDDAPALLRPNRAGAERHCAALAEIRSDCSRRNRSPPRGRWAPGSFAYRPTLRTCPEGKPAPDRGTCSQGGMGCRQIPRRSPDTPRPHHRCPDTNRENNPMQSRMARLAALRPLASGSRDGPSPRDGAGQRRQSCMCKRRVRARPAPMQVRSRFQCGDGSGPPCRSPNCCAPGMQGAPRSRRGAVNGESCYEARPRLPAVTPVSNNL